MKKKLSIDKQSLRKMTRFLYFFDSPQNNIQRKRSSLFHLHFAVQNCCESVTIRKACRDWRRKKKGFASRASSCVPPCYLAPS